MEYACNNCREARKYVHNNNVIIGLLVKPVYRTEEKKMVGFKAVALCYHLNEMAELCPPRTMLYTVWQNESNGTLFQPLIAFCCCCCCCYFKFRSVRFCVSVTNAISDAKSTRWWRLSSLHHFFFKSKTLRWCDFLSSPEYSWALGLHQIVFFFRCCCM